MVGTRKRTSRPERWDHKTRIRALEMLLDTCDPLTTKELKIPSRLTKHYNGIFHCVNTIIKEGSSAFFKDGFTFRKRLSKEDEHHDIMYGDINVELHQHFKWKLL